MILFFIYFNLIFEFLLQIFLIERVLILSEEKLSSLLKLFGNSNELALYKLLLDKFVSFKPIFFPLNFDDSLIKFVLNSLKVHNLRENF